MKCLGFQGLYSIQQPKKELRLPRFVLDPAKGIGAAPLITNDRHIGQVGDYRNH
ncbi:hypothetical protein KFK09_013368 [Dendrobium nobile]|uniref:Uncharacterized protein n=1 Tax=Dendrobium nobile TaxID=94219 RepID=A0A8T3B9Y9_DENNO|nr:hypothetical protein KFK09_013368 [Dendrobium nobile]